MTTNIENCFYWSTIYINSKLMPKMTSKHLNETNQLLYPKYINIVIHGIHTFFEEKEGENMRNHTYICTQERFSCAIFVLVSGGEFVVLQIRIILVIYS